MLSAPGAIANPGMHPALLAAGLGAAAAAAAVAQTNSMAVPGALQGGAGGGGARQRLRFPLQLQPPVQRPGTLHDVGCHPHSSSEVAPACKWSACAWPAFLYSGSGALSDSHPLPVLLPSAAGALAGLNAAAMSGPARQPSDLQAQAALLLSGLGGGGLIGAGLPGTPVAPG